MYMLLLAVCYVLGTQRIWSMVLTLKNGVNLILHSAL